MTTTIRARITMLRFLADRAEEAFGVVAKSIVPTIKEQHGCRGVLLLRALNGDAATVTLWETETAMAAAASGNYPLQLAKLDGMLREPPARQTHEVIEFTLGPGCSGRGDEAEPFVARHLAAVDRG